MGGVKNRNNSSRGFKDFKRDMKAQNSLNQETSEAKPKVCVILLIIYQYDKVF